MREIDAAFSRKSRLDFQMRRPHYPEVGGPLFEAAADFRLQLRVNHDAQSQFEKSGCSSVRPVSFSVPVLANEVFGMTLLKNVQSAARLAARFLPE